MEGYGADNLECDHTACAGQPGNQDQLAWAERQALVDQLDLLL